MQTKINTTRITTLQIISLLFFLAMVFVNFLANFLPINGKDTGQVSAQYPNLFVPAPLTFSIWGVIYFLLFVFCIYQLTAVSGLKADAFTSEITQRINGAFILSCLINMCWIIAWHYDFILLSVILMLLLLGRLIYINTQILLLEPYLSGAGRFVVKAPFGLYVGWICIATIANITALLVSYGWHGFGMSEESWAAMMVFVGSVIGFAAVLRFTNFYVGLAVVWALCGIIVERKSHTVYYEYVVLSAIAGIIVMTIGIVIELVRSIFRRKRPVVYNNT